MHFSNIIQFYINKRSDIFAKYNQYSYFSKSIIRNSPNFSFC